MFDMDKFCQALNVFAETIMACDDLHIPYAQWDVPGSFSTPTLPLLECYAVLDGKYGFSCGNQAVQVGRGDVVLQNAHFGNAGALLSGSGLHGCISVRCPGRLLPAAMSKKPFMAIWQGGAHPGFHELGREVCRELSVDSPAFRSVRQKASLLRFCVALHELTMQKADTPDSYHARIARQALAIMHQRLGDASLDITSVSRELQVSLNCLETCFKKAMGCTPGRYLQKARLNRAAFLLERSAFSVKEVAAAVGYRDPLYFSRAFRKYFAQPPSHYRENRQSRSPRGCNTP